MFSATFRRRVKKLLIWTEVLIILVLVAGGSMVLGAVYQFNKLLPKPEAIDRYRPPVGSEIYSADGMLLARLAVENRDPVTLDEVPEQLRNAIVAVEDERFYKHRGLDYRGIARALWVNVQGGETQQGASTITQQLARNMFLSQRRELSRKIKEVLLAVEIERNWTKRQILQAYANQVYFGAGAYGVKAAAQTYFNKGLKELTLAECAMLAGMIQRPSKLSPYRASAKDKQHSRTKARRNIVLDLMWENGFIKKREDWRAAKTSPVQVAAQRPKVIGYFRAKYFVQNVVDDLRDRFGLDEEEVAKGGYRIVTTLNWKLQQHAEQVAREGVASLRRYHVSEAALVALDPHTGAVRALVGGVQEPWEKYQFDCATQARRQPGSTFKTFVYGAAIENSDSKQAYSTVSAIPRRRVLARGKVWQPTSHGITGRVGYVQAFAASLNGAAVSLCQEIGPKAVIGFARKLGVKSPLSAVESLALGSSEVTVLEMASAFGVFAAGGRRATPTFIEAIHDLDGKPLEGVEPEVTPGVISERTVRNMNVLTRAVVTSGTGRAASGIPGAHGKTGTTEQHGDGWFVGYTNQLATAVWAGNRDNSRMRGLFGGQSALPIWTRFMSSAPQLLPIKKPKSGTLLARGGNGGTGDGSQAGADGSVSADADERNLLRVRVCSLSGLRARRSCPGGMQEFLNGTQPRGRCRGHGTRSRPKRTEENADSRREEQPKERAEPQPEAAPALEPEPKPAMDSPGTETTGGGTTGTGTTGN